MNNPRTGTLVVMQPTFLPWVGYFNLILQANDFVFLDDVQLEKQSWQTRNRLLVGGRESWVSLPVKHEKLDQTINESQLFNLEHWQKKFERSFQLNYARHPYYEDAREVIDILLRAKEFSLANLNEAIIKFICLKLGLNARIHRSCELGIEGIRSERLIAFCKHFQASEYLSPRGSEEYLTADKFEARSPAILRFQNFHPSSYPQKGTDVFVSHLSIIDVAANLGWASTRKYIELGSTSLHLE